jgi:hypothetical protein
MGLVVFYIIFFTFRLNVMNIPHNTINPMEHCYRSELCYGEDQLLKLQNAITVTIQNTTEVYFYGFLDTASDNSNGTASFGVLKGLTKIEEQIR